MMTPCVIFDIDGTLANVTHRQHYVQNKPKNWTKFNEMMIHDQPHTDIVGLFHRHIRSGDIVLCASGREDRFRDFTANWLMIYGVEPYRHTPTNGLYMRKAGDNRADYIIKKEILDQIRADGFKPWLVYDDRDQVVQMWRDNGIRCLQVAPGAF